jgi:SAM-dependent methyltransferase
MLDAARAKASDLPNPPRFELGDAIDPPFAPASFDAICNRHLLWTLSEPAAALANWFKLLRPGGRLIVIDGLWFANRRPGEDAVDDDDRRQFHQTYTPEIVEKLPAMHFTTVEQVADLLCECGYLSVEISGLADVERAEESVHGPLQEPPRFVVVGRKPD